MKPFLSCSFVLTSCLVVGGCGSAGDNKPADKQPADKHAPKTHAEATGKVAPAKLEPSKSSAPDSAAPGDGLSTTVPSKSAGDTKSAPAAANESGSVPAETKKPPAEEDPFPDGEPK